MAERDDVDRLVESWARERPELDLTPLQVLSRITRLARRLDRVRRAEFARHGLEPWEFDVLAALRRSGPPHELSPGRLTAETGVTSGTMTNRLDGVEARGLVVRSPSASDRRGVQVALTPVGLELVDAALTGLLAREHALLADLGERDRESLADLLRRIAVPLERSAEQ